MGSGNKEKRKRRAPGERPEPPQKPADLPPVGVRFELEPDADQIFRDSMRQWDARLADFEEELAAVEPKPGRSGRPARPAPVEIDLHRLRLDEATARVDAAIAAALATGQLTSLKVITGKGLHSGPGGGVLAREIHRYIAQRYAPHIKEMEESPADVTLGGVPLRGHFLVTVKKS